jgi:hypothetical protein
VKTSRLKKPVVHGKAAAVAATPPKSTAPLAPRRDASKEEMARIAAAFENEWPELAPHPGMPIPAESTYTEFTYAAASEGLLTKLGAKDAHRSIFDHRLSYRGFHSLGWEPEDVAAKFIAVCNAA